MTWLGTFSANARPRDVRACLDAYYCIRDTVVALRAELAAEGAPLADRIAMATVFDDVEQGIASAHRWLSRAARRGAGRSPAVMAQGCAASSPAVGPAPAEASGATVAAPDDPLCFASERQSLPAVAAADATQTEAGAASL